MRAFVFVSDANRFADSPSSFPIFPASSAETLMNLGLRGGRGGFDVLGTALEEAIGDDFKGGRWRAVKETVYFRMLKSAICFSGSWLV
jgi:hypothetical protein